MLHTNRFHTVLLAASIALALGSTAAMAATAPPAATQLPGEGTVSVGSVVAAGTITTGVQTINITGNAVISWGETGGTINAGVTGQPAGFNVGSAAALHFAGQTGGGTMDAVLNIDTSGNPSQIMGMLDDVGSLVGGGTNIFVANANGIIVGSKATIASNGAVGLIANTRGGGTFDGTAGTASIEYQGSGGSVDVATGADISGATVLVSGGNVNIDLSAITGGALTVQAGVKNSASTLVKDDATAVLTATGDFGGTSVASFASAGDASTSDTLSLGSNAHVAGTLTNTGDLTLGAGFAIAGGLVNNAGTVTQADDASMGSLVNAGAYDGATFGLTTTDGGITNNASITGLGAVTISGDFTNSGKFVSGTFDVSGGGNVVNKGEATLNRVNINNGGDFTNDGTMTVVNNVRVVNGSIANSGKLTVSALETASDLTAGKGFIAGADYSITNTGTVTSAGDLQFGANSTWWSDYDSSSKNDSTGSISSTGILQVGANSLLNLDAHNDTTLAGTVQAFNGTKYAALSAANSLNSFGISAGDYDGFVSQVLNADGVATVATDIVTDGGIDAYVYGSQVKLMGNLSSVDSDGVATGTINIVGGAQADGDYAVRVAAGKTVSAVNITVNGDQPGDAPNVIVQGTLEGNTIAFGNDNDVSDVFTGPKGSLSLVDLGPYLEFQFTGAIKTVPYNNTTTNFRYNGLNVVTDGSGPLRLRLDPTVYQTSGTADGSAVNILVNGDVDLQSVPMPMVGTGDTAVIGVTNIPNTHLVLQSSGKITTQGTSPAGFYWPGYVYLGNVSADADGNALPGTLGLGTITTHFGFNNVLPGDVSGASGIHFITQFPLNLGGTVVTNANAWVNFGTDLLTAKYASEQGVGGPFFGGSQTVGTVVNYDELDPSLFHTHAPTAAK